jgi:hypothetical protein
VKIRVVDAEIDVEASFLQKVSYEENHD